jgi:hypothetical protein
VISFGSQFLHAHPHPRLNCKEAATATPSKQYDRTPNPSKVKAATTGLVASSPSLTDLADADQSELELAFVSVLAILFFFLSCFYLKPLVTDG